MTWNGDTIVIDPSAMTSIPMPNGKVKLLRASYYLMGAMLGRFGEATIGLPGGCNFEPDQLISISKVLKRLAQ